MTQTEKFPTERQLRLGSMVFTLPMNIHPGHTLSEKEALFFNTAYQGAAANAFGTRFKKLVEDGKTQAEIQAELAQFYTDYDWTPRGSGESIDPVDREVNKQARSEVAIAMQNRPQERGGPVSFHAQTKEVQQTLVAKWLEKNGTRIRKEVEKRIANLANQLDDLNIDDLVAESDAQKAAAAASAEA